jgi:antitoxin HigA-1
MTTNGMRAIHPGEILREEYLQAYGLSANALARLLKVPPSRVNDIVLERRGITPDTALRLARFFGGDPQSWLNLQVAFDLKIASRESAKAIAREVPTVAELAATDERFALAA